MSLSKQTAKDLNLQGDLVQMAARICALVTRIWKKHRLYNIIIKPNVQSNIIDICCDYN